MQQACYRKSHSYNGMNERKEGVCVDLLFLNRTVIKASNFVPFFTLSTQCLVPSTNQENSCVVLLNVVCLLSSQTLLQFFSKFSQEGEISKKSSLTSGNSTWVTNCFCPFSLSLQLVSMFFSGKKFCYRDSNLNKNTCLTNLTFYSYRSDVCCYIKK